MKILYGMYKPDEGEILLDGAARDFHSPADALAHDIGMIHQHFMLVPTLTVAENVALGLKSRRAWCSTSAACSERLLKLAQVYGLKVNPDAYIWQLSVGEQQRVEIIKALYHGGALVILDEPTAVLTPQECSELFVTLKEMRTQGHALIFISHKLHEVQELSDRVTVMRDGRVIDTAPNVNLDRRQLARMMVGRDVVFQPERPPVEAARSSCRCATCAPTTIRSLPALRRRVARRARRGNRRLGGRIRQRSARACRDDCRAAPRHRRRDQHRRQERRPRLDRGAAATRGWRTSPKNATATASSARFRWRRTPFCKTTPTTRAAFSSTSARSTSHAATLIRSFNIKTPNAQTPAKNLSGGNVQKLILARELARNRGADRRAADARRRHQRDRVHPSRADRAAQRRRRHPADLGRLGRNSRA